MRNLFFVVLLFTSMIAAQVMGPKLTVKEAEYDFGEVLEGETVVYNYTVLNSGGDLLVINSVKASCGCTAAVPDKKELNPGETTSIQVEFNTAGRRGPQKKYVYIFSNDPDTPEFRLTFTADIKENPERSSHATSPRLELSKTQHNFGLVTEGEVVDFEVELSNPGKAALVVKEIKTSCGCTAALLSKKVIEPRKSANLKIELDTSNRSGKMTRTVVIYSNDPVQPQQVITLYVNIKKRET